MDRNANANKESQVNLENNMKPKSLAIGSTLAAFLASLCCLGPVVLGTAGLGAVLVATFAPLRPYFLTISAVLLAAGFYFVYRKPATVPVCAGETCEPESKTRRMAKTVLWLASLAVMALALFPVYGSKLARGVTPAKRGPIAASQTVELKVDGMTCEVCAAGVQRKLLQTPGVVTADVRYPAGSATIQFDSARTDAQKLISVVNDAGYKAELLGSAQR